MRSGVFSWRPAWLRRELWSKETVPLGETLRSWVWGREIPANLAMNFEVGGVPFFCAVCTIEGRAVDSSQAQSADQRLASAWVVDREVQLFRRTDEPGRISRRSAKARLLQLKCTHSVLLSTADSWRGAVVGGRIFHWKKIGNQKKLSKWHSVAHIQVYFCKDRLVTSSSPESLWNGMRSRLTASSSLQRCSKQQ
jgi:hypothetical protein